MIIVMHMKITQITMISMTTMANFTKKMQLVDMVNIMRTSKIRMGMLMIYLRNIRLIIRVYMGRMNMDKMRMNKNMICLNILKIVSGINLLMKKFPKRVRSSMSMIFSHSISIS